MSEGHIKWRSVAHTWDGAPAEPHEVVRVGVYAQPDGGLRFRIEAPFHDDPPPDAPPGRTDGLWEHEVVEVFICGAGDRYLELELAPERYLFLEFEGRRKRVADQIPGVTWTTARRDRATASTWSATLTIPGERLPPAPLRWNAYAAHGQGAERRLLAMHPVPGERPDFHDLSAFRPLPL